MTVDPPMHPRLDFLLKYSSDARRDAYRGPDHANIPRSSLSYEVVSAAQMSGKGADTAQARFRDKVVLVPTTALKGKYRASALIDRMIIVLKTEKVTSWSGILGCTKRVGLRCFVDDMGVGRRNIDFGAGIRIPPEMSAGSGTGRVFAILIQEPRPRQLIDMLDAIRGDFGILGDARIFLLELALDFYPVSSLEPVDRIRLRERMVGLLQRHHHVAEAGYLDARADARQTYEAVDSAGEILSETSFLFSSPKKTKRVRPDTDIEYPDVQKRLHHGRVGNQLFLDATLYKGSQLDGLLYRIQHKITDRRDKGKKTVLSLPESKRRARIEAEISGYERLEKLGLRNPGDLFGCDFRMIRNRYLQFWLPTMPESRETQVTVRREFESRGLYGTEIMKRLIAHEAKIGSGPHLTKPESATNNRRGRGTTEERISWIEMNNRVGEALDGLSGRWARFKGQC